MTFLPGETFKDILLQVRSDGVPEFEERFIVHLTGVSGGVDGSPPSLQPGKGAREATLIVAPNDDPNGRLAFDAASAKVHIHEDVEGGGD